MAKSDEIGGDPGPDIARSLERLGRIMRAAEHDGGLNPAQWEGLRYLGRANRFSNSPGALTRYLGATKGTVSQTLKALERKGFIAKSARPGVQRSIILTLTAKGEKALAGDPWNSLATIAEELGGKTRRRLAKGLQEVLNGALRKGGLRRFGSCPDCRFFREKGRPNDPSEPHSCMLFDAGMAPSELHRICVGYEPA
ncbi:MAG: MarR family transcriptional regulator [Rhizobiales bacterium]|nr:MarR family transcriptional regulator [Hyphomicrobiales bacterium]